MTNEVTNTLLRSSAVFVASYFHIYSVIAHFAQIFH